MQKSKNISLKLLLLPRKVFIDFFSVIKRSDTKRRSPSRINFLAIPFPRNSFMTRIIVADCREFFPFLLSFCEYLGSINVLLLIYVSIKTSSESLLSRFLLSFKFDFYKRIKVPRSGFFTLLGTLFTNLFLHYNNWQTIVLNFKLFRLQCRPNFSSEFC